MRQVQPVLLDSHVPLEAQEVLRLHQRRARRTWWTLSPAAAPDEQPTDSDRQPEPVSHVSRPGRNTLLPHGLQSLQPHAPSLAPSDGTAGPLLQQLAALQPVSAEAAGGRRRQASRLEAQAQFVEPRRMLPVQEGEVHPTEQQRKFDRQHSRQSVAADRRRGLLAPRPVSGEAAAEQQHERLQQPPGTARQGRSQVRRGPRCDPEGPHETRDRREENEDRRRS